MELSECRLFVSIVQTLNFSKTAELFYISQPAVSHKIKLLEHDLGIKLIDRSTHQVSVTPDGMEFYEYAVQILELADQAKARMQNLAEGKAGRLKIAALPSSSSELMQCLSPFSEHFPAVQTDIDLLEGPDMVKALEQNSYNIYFATDKMLPAGNSFDSIFVLSFQLYLFMPENLAPVFRQNDWSSIAHLPFISVLRRDNALFFQAKSICQNRGIKYRVINYYNRAESILISVSAGIGIAILPEAFKRNAAGMHVAAIPILGEDATVNSVIAWNRDNVTLTAKQFLETASALFPAHTG